MSNIYINKQDVENICITITARQMAGILLNENIESQTDFFSKFFSCVSFDTLSKLGNTLGKNDAIYDAIKNLYEQATITHEQVIHKRQEYEQSEEAKRDKEYNDRLFEYSPDGRPWF